MATLSDLAVQIAGDIKDRALAEHTHPIGDVDGLRAALDEAGPQQKLVASGTDMNTLTAPGVYVVTPAVAPTLQNWPIPFAGTMTVESATGYHLASQSVYFLTGSSNPPSFHYRIKHGTAVTAWTPWGDPTFAKARLSGSGDLFTLAEGTYTVSTSGAGSWANMPEVGAATITVSGSRNDAIRSIRVEPYNRAYWFRTVTRTTTGEFMPWEKYDLSALATKQYVDDATGGAGGSSEDAYVQHQIRQTQFMHAMGGPIDTGGKGAVAFRIDHGFANFASELLPLFRAAGIVPSMVMNPRNWARPENGNITATDLNGWVAAGEVEVWNHGADHTDVSTEEDLYDQIVNSLTEIEAQVPAAAGKVWGFAPPGVNTTSGYGGYGNGNSPEKWDTPAGRLILKHHAVSAAYLPGTGTRVLDGTPRDGLSHYTVDSWTFEQAKARIDEGIATGQGVQFMVHPYLINREGYASTATISAIIDYVVQRRDAGDLVTLSPYQMLVADSTQSSTTRPYDSGVRQINSSISAGWTPATDGARILRHGREVTLYVDLYRVGELTASFDAVIDIPAGFRPMGVGYQSPGKVTSGPSGWWEMSQNNLRLRDLTAPIVDGARIRNTIKWTTLEAPPATPPGSAV